MCVRFITGFFHYFHKKMILLRLSFIFAVVNSGLIDYGPIFGIGTDVEPLSECP